MQHYALKKAAIVLAMSFLIALVLWALGLLRGVAVAYWSRGWAPTVTTEGSRRVANASSRLSSTRIQAVDAIGDRREAPLLQGWRQR